MVTLAQSFKRSGFQFTQLQRENNLAIYHKQRLGGKAESWEVIRIGSNKGKGFAGASVELAETYPSSEQWGISGFTCYSPEDASNRIAMMKARQSRG